MPTREKSPYLIVGVANPGKEYAQTRHNAGAWLVEQLASILGTPLTQQTKFQAKHAKSHLNDQVVHLLIPLTFMNLSGRALSAASKFYKIPTSNILVVHDELDLPTGTIRFKQGGGHGGHNGLRNIIEHLENDKSFHRLRIGIGHPGDKHKVTPYVLSPPNTQDREKIDNGINKAIDVLAQYFSPEKEKAIQTLHDAT